MAIKRRISLFFGPDALSLVELERAKVINHYHVPYDIITKDESQVTPSLTDEIRITAVLQKTLRDYKIEIPDCFASIATKDIILRSFFIPPMSSQEIVGAVEFEARKYIPFKVDELVYDFQSTPVKEDGSRKLRILFVGIRKDILSKYLYILNQSNLRIVSLEPSPISLLRILTQKKRIISAHSCAVIEVDHEQGNIMILDKGLPQFIRDFKLLPSSVSIDEGKEVDSSFIRLLNEVRVSLDYYRRQFPRGIFDKIIFCSERDIKKWAEDLQKELNLPVEYLKPQDILDIKDNVDIGLLKAAGAGVKDYVNLPIAINLSKKRVVQEAKEKEKQPQVQPLRAKTIIRWALAAVAFIFLVFLFSMRQVWDIDAQIKKITQISSKYRGSSSTDIKFLISEINKKLSTLKDIKFRANFTPGFSSFSRLLPSGVWINTFDMQYNEPEKSLSLTLNGSVYTEEASSHINIVNKFLENLKKDTQFSKPFKAIDLSFVNQNYVGEFKVTNFEIKCK